MTLTLVIPVGTVNVAAVEVYLQVVVMPEVTQEPPVAMAETAPPEQGRERDAEAEQGHPPAAAGYA